YKYGSLFFINMVNYKVYLFRHGKTFFNTKGIFTGWKDSKLTPEGIRNAKKVAEILKKKKFQVAFQTRLSRSKDTLKYVLKFHPECKKIITDNRMIERSYGVLEGKSHKIFIDEIGKKMVDLKIEGDAIENLNLKERKKVEKFLGEEEYKAIHRGYNVAVPRGESFADVENRVKKFIIYLKKFIKKNKVNVAISAHGNSIRLFRKILEKTSKNEAVGWFIPYDRVFEYNLSG
ncbi:MAG: histidine phosphatase family protein, partial [Nanoarchaeota archaeon]